MYPEANLISYWNLNEASGNRADSKGSNTLTDVNTVGSVSDGLMGTVASFVAANSEGLKITDGAQSGLDVTGDITMNIWFKPTTVQASIFVMGKWYHSVANQYGMYLNPTTGAFTFATDNVCSGYTYTNQTKTYGALSTSNWYMLTLKRTGTTAEFYINGTSLGTATVETSANCTADFALGFEAGRNLLYVNAKMCKAGIWSRALSDSEITTLYNSGNGLIYPFPTTEPPVLDTLAVDDIGKTTATLNGEITDVGVDNADLRGFVYATTSYGDPGDVAPADTDYSNYTSESGDFSEGVFDDGVTGLSAETTYYVRAWAHNDDGYSYGDEVSFETLPIVYAISGAVTLGGTAIEGAVVRCVRQSDNVAITEQTTDSGGLYAFSDLDVAELYHLAVEYSTESLKYNALSYWDIEPYEVD